MRWWDFVGIKEWPQSQRWMTGDYETGPHILTGKRLYTHDMGLTSTSDTQPDPKMVNVRSPERLLGLSSPHCQSPKIRHEDTQFIKLYYLIFALINMTFFYIIYIYPIQYLLLFTNALAKIIVILL